MKKYILLFAAVFALVLLIYPGCTKKSTPEPETGSKETSVKPQPPETGAPEAGAEKAPKASGEVIEIRNKEEFTKILASNKVVLADFNADWCPPCKKLKPIIKEVAKEYADKATVVSINVDNLKELTAEYSIAGYPTVILFNNGKIVKQILGLMEKEVYIEFINGALK